MRNINLLPRAPILLIISAIRILTPRPNPRPKPPKQKRNGTARKRNKRQQRTRPLVPQPVIHLGRKQHHRGAPETPQEGFRGQRGRRLVLVRVDEVVVRAVVQEDEAESHGEAAHHGPPGAEMGVGGPREDE